MFIQGEPDVGLEKIGTAKHGQLRWPRTSEVEVPGHKYKKSVDTFYLNKRT